MQCQIICIRLRKCLFLRIYDLEGLAFSRFIKPLNSVGKPSLMMFCGASKVAFGCRAYIRWQLMNANSRLLASKSKLAHKREITIP